MEMFLALLPMVYIFLSLFVLLECALIVVIGALWGHFFKPEKNLEFFRLKNDPRDAAPGRLE